MSTISRLPESITRLLGSPSVITTPAALVKELVDNSIDARATSIEIIISTDTVKKIEVRDNGFGIHQDDYDALGRRGHTSKLRSFEELKTRTSKTLGFRGEALASANSLAQVTITTKIASEPVASILHILPGTGGVSKQQRTSAPVGTTVSITGLFSRLPVREQVAVKESSKTIDKIRDLLRSYAMARPQLKLSFKVSQSPKQSWSYAPKPSAGVKEAAVQLFGAELATYCFEKTFEIGGPAENSTSDEHGDAPPNDHYLFKAFILKSDSDPSKVPKQRYFSVDGRPINSKKGITKKLLSIYVEHISATSRSTIPKDCFISLNIECPPGSYDVNIEPSKDDVLFSDENAVLDGFKNLCKAVYESCTVDNACPKLRAGRDSSSDNESDILPQRSPHLHPRIEPVSKGLASPESSSRTPDRIIPQSSLTTQPQEQHANAASQCPPSQVRGVGQRSFNPTTIMFAPTQAPNVSSPSEATATGSKYPGDIPSTTRHAQWKVDMSTDFNRPSIDQSRKVTRPNQILPDFQEDPAAVGHSTPQDVNPWVIAKMNASQTTRAARNPGTGELTQRDKPSAPEFEPPMSPDPPILHHTRAAPRDLDVPPSQRNLGSKSTTHQSRPMVPGGPYQCPLSSPAGRGSQMAMGIGSRLAASKLRRHQNYLPWSPPSSVERTVPNTSDGFELRPVPDGLAQTTINFKGMEGDRRRRRPQDNDGELDQHSLPDREPQGDNDFQQMLAAAKMSLNHQVSRQAEPFSSQQPPHQAGVRSEPGQTCGFRQDHVPCVQEENSTSVKEPIMTTIPTCDPRAYLLRRQKSIGAEDSGSRPKKIRRMKSFLLPFESVPSDDQTHSFVLVEVLNVELLTSWVRHAAHYDGYARNGGFENGLEMSLEEGREVEGRLGLLLQTWKDVADSENIELQINLCSLLKGKGTGV
ncbi:hypothetical protein GGR54DRAFT_268886 [Hypoxylon sp. NC1633]|nr:hypothetical protein GGR54DRAFT_268886 [Hypoxylon sp. NC1633]